MRHTLIRWLLAIVRWLEPGAVHLFVPEDALLRRTRALVAAMHQRGPETDGGEWRRAQVYGRLLQEFPRASRRRIGLVIEVALGD